MPPVFAKYTAREERDGEPYWSLDEGFDIAITDAVFAWVSRTIPVDLNPYTEKFQQQARELLETYRAVSGVHKEQSVRTVGLQNYGTHRFRFDGPGRDVEVQVAADAAAFGSWAANSIAQPVADGHRLIGGWALGVDDAWVVEAARVTVTTDEAKFIVGNRRCHADRQLERRRSAPGFWYRRPRAAHPGADPRHGL